MKIFTAKFQGLTKFIWPVITAIVGTGSILWGIAQNTAIEGVAKKSKLDSISIVAKQSKIQNNKIDTILIYIRSIDTKVNSNSEITTKLNSAMEKHMQNSPNKDDIINFYQIMLKNSSFESNEKKNFFSILMKDTTYLTQYRN